MPPETSPFLVTKSKGGVLWVDESPSGNIKAGVCVATPPQVYMKIVDAVVEKGIEMNWGNVHPFSLEGIKAAADYLNFYGFTDMEVLVSRVQLPKHALPKENVELEKLLEKAMGKRKVLQQDRPVKHPECLTPDTTGLPLCPVTWLPKNYAVVIPGDRSYLGELTRITASHVAAIVHNPSRSIAVARGKPE